MQRIERNLPCGLIYVRNDVTCEYGELIKALDPSSDEDDDDDDEDDDEEDEFGRGERYGRENTDKKTPHDEAAAGTGGASGVDKSAGPESKATQAASSSKFSSSADNFLGYFLPRLNQDKKAGRTQEQKQELRQRSPPVSQPPPAREGPRLGSGSGLGLGLAGNESRGELPRSGPPLIKTTPPPPSATHTAEGAAKLHSAATLKVTTYLNDKGRMQLMLTPPSATPSALASGSSTLSVKKHKLQPAWLGSSDRLADLCGCVGLRDALLCFGLWQGVAHGAYMLLTAEFFTFGHAGCNYWTYCGLLISAVFDFAFAAMVVGAVAWKSLRLLQLLDTACSALVSAFAVEFVTRLIKAIFARSQLTRFIVVASVNLLCVAVITIFGRGVIRSYRSVILVGGDGQEHKTWFQIFIENETHTPIQPKPPPPFIQQATRQTSPTGISPSGISPGGISPKSSRVI